MFELPCTNSTVSRLDPRWKLAALLLAGIAVLFLQTAAGALAGLVGAAILALLARLPRRWCLQRLGGVLLMLAPFLLFLPFLTHANDQQLEIGSLVFSQHGLLLALVLALKTLALVLLVLVILATAPLHVTGQAAQAIGMPRVLVQLAMLSYRYVFLLGSEMTRLRIALRVRGYRNRLDLRTYRTIGHVTGTLLVRSHDRAEAVVQAMRSRGFSGQFHSLLQFHTTRKDVVAFLVIIAAALLILGGDLWLAGIV